MPHWELPQIQTLRNRDGEGHDLVDLVNRGAAHPERRPAPAAPSLLKARHEQVNLAANCGLKFAYFRSGQLDRAGPDPFAVGVGRLVRIVGDRWLAGRLQQFECAAQNIALERGIVGHTERTAERERHPERPRRTDGLGMLADQADAGRRNAVALEEVREDADGGRADRSNRHQHGGIDAQIVQAPRDLRAGLFEEKRFGRPEDGEVDW